MEFERRAHLPLRALVPNAITALALCSGLTAIRYAISADWSLAVLCVVFAGVFDVLDGRVARLLRGTSRFGAELDSLSDVVAFGVAPALIIYLWSLQTATSFGWLAALAHSVCCALRLARYNAQLDAEELPYKRAGYLTGIPAPGGAGIALIPLFLWLAIAQSQTRTVISQSIQYWAHSKIISILFLTASALLMIVSLPSWSWRVLLVPARHRIPALLLIGLVFGAILTLPWVTLTIIAIIYFITIPLAWWRYTKMKARSARKIM